MFNIAINFSNSLRILYFLPVFLSFFFLPVRANILDDTYVLKPLTGINFILGSQRIVGYFENIQNTCLLKLFVARDAHLEEEFKFSVPVRIFHKAGVGQKILVNSPEAQALEFTCDKLAETMTVRSLGKDTISNKLAHTLLN